MSRSRSLYLILTLVMIAVLSVVFVACNIDTGDSCEHEYSYEIKQLPTMDAEGSMTVKCSKCELNEEIIIPSLSDMSTWSWKVESKQSLSCEQGGIVVYTSVRPYGGIVVEINTEARGHILSELVAEVSSTCTVHGVKAHKECSECGKYFDADGNEITSLELPLADHKIGELIAEVPSTCISHGVKAHKECSECGKLFDKDGKAVESLELPLVGHNFGDLVEKKDSTCSVAGTKAHYVCSVCGVCYDENKENKLDDLIIPVKAHEYDEGTVIFDPTCYSLGIKEFKCNNCDHPYYEDIAMVAHVPEKLDGFAATCWSKGLTDGEYCSVCGEIFNAQQEISALEHKYELTETIDATCISEGYKNFTCSLCGDVKVETIEKIDHTPEKLEGYDATCTEPGLSDGLICSYCGTITQKQEVISAKGHTKDNGVIDSEPTCTEVGSKLYTCEHCDETWVEEIPAKGHEHVKVEGIPATCTVSGLSDGEECFVCGEILVAQTVVPALGHDWDEGEILVQVTCTHRGEISHECSRCDASYIEYIKATGHSYSEAWSYDGTNHFHKCENCDAVSDKASHKDNNKDHKCDVCGYTMSSCVDRDKNHSCDSCGASMGTHVQAPGKHTCDYCGQVMSAHEGGTATCKESATCTVCGQKYGSKDPANHVGHIIWVTDDTYHQQKYDCCNLHLGAKELHDLNENNVCTVCGHGCKHSDTVHTEGLGPTCTEEGHIEYWTCDHCSTIFSDEACTQPVANVVIPAKGHSLGSLVSAKEPNCTEAGYHAYYQCSACSVYFDANRKETTWADLEIETLGHNSDGVIAHKDANCTESGVVGGTYCTRCNDGKAAAETVINALGHSYGDWIAEIPASCTEEGTLGHYHCSECSIDFDSNKAILDNLVIKKVNHTPAEAVRENEQDANCTEKGHYDSVVYCSVCGDELSKESNIEIPAKGHDWSESWIGVEEGHYHICTREGCSAHDTLVDHVDVNPKDDVCDDCGYDWSIPKGSSIDTAYTADELWDDFGNLEDKAASDDKYYVKGTIINTPSYDTTYQSWTFDIISSKDGKTVKAYSVKLSGSVTEIYQNDEVVVYGYIKMFGTTLEVAYNAKVSPEVVSREAGESSVTITENDNADISANKLIGINGDEIIITVTPKNSAKIDGVYVNNTLVKASDDGKYRTVLAGDIVISVSSHIPGTVTKEFVKVTDINTITDGSKVLIVYEAGNYAFDGSRSTLDASGNRISAQVSAGKIDWSAGLEKSVFTLNVLQNGNYTIQSSSGYYIGTERDANSLKTNETNKYENIITIDSSYNAVIKSANGGYLRYNSTESDGNRRFRYYKSSSYTSQKAIALYILVGDSHVHSYENGYCECGEMDPDYTFSVSISDLQGESKYLDHKVKFIGTVVEIEEAYNSQYGNITIYVADENGNRIYVYRLKANVSLCDVVTVEGKYVLYGSTYEIDKNATATIGEKNHSGGTADCQHKAICSICGEEYGELGEHSWSDEWSKDENKHWHVCTVEGCTAKNNEAGHDFTNGDCICGVKPVTPSGDKLEGIWGTKDGKFVLEFDNGKFYYYTDGGYAEEWSKNGTIESDLIEEEGYYSFIYAFGKREVIFVFEKDDAGNTTIILFDTGYDDEIVLYYGETGSGSGGDDDPVEDPIFGDDAEDATFTEPQQGTYTGAFGKYPGDFTITITDKVNFNCFGAGYNVTESAKVKDGVYQVILFICDEYTDYINFSFNDNGSLSVMLSFGDEYTATATKQGSSSHTCVYDQEVVDAKYLKSAATCTEPAVYYKSCSCGEFDINVSETFTSGSALGHDFSSDWSSDENYHWHACKNGCDEQSDKDVHKDSGNGKCECGYTIPSVDTKQYFVKVTNISQLKNGSKILIVYEDGALAFDGSLSELDAINNNTPVTISDGKISNSNLDKYTFAISITDAGYTIKSNDGYYIGRSSDSNGLDSNKSKSYINSISVNTDGSVDIVSGGAYLRYNAAKDQKRYRYFSSKTYTKQKPIAIYLLDSSSSGGDETHTHSITKTDANDATCTEVGNIACWYCSVCEKYFIDEACTTELTDVNKDGKVDAKDAEIAALGHTYGINKDLEGSIAGYIWNADYTECVANGICSRCDDTTTVESISVTINDLDSTPATCKEYSKTVYVAEFDDEASWYCGQRNIVTGTTLADHDYDSYDICKVCQEKDPSKVFYLIGYIDGNDYGCESDGANLGDYEFANGSVEVKFTNNSYVFVKAKTNSAWYMTDGWLGTDVQSAILYNTNKELSNANKLFVPGNSVVTFTLTYDRENDTIKLSYTWFCQTHNWNDATCTAPKTCSVCGAIEGTALGHSVGEWIEAAGTCQSAAVIGHYECKTCGVNLASDKQTVITIIKDDKDPDNHEGTPSTEWQKDASGHWHVYSCCGVKTNEAAHTPDHEGSATEEYAIKCKDCDYVIEAQKNHEHTYGEAKYFTNENQSDFWAIRTCASCNADAEGHTEEAFGTLEGIYSNHPLCEEEGYILAWVDFEANWVESNGEYGCYRFTIPAVGHSPSYHKETAAKYNEPGNNEYWICSRCKKYFSDAECTKEITDKDSVIIPALNRVYFTNTIGWENVYIYAWVNGESDTTGWSDHTMIKGSDNQYYYDLESKYDMVIFHNNSGTQTGDLDLVNEKVYEPFKAIHYYNYNNWENIYVHHWVDDGYSCAWGTCPAMSADGDGWYTIYIRKECQKVIFKNSSGDESKQTDGIVIDWDAPYYFYGSWVNSKAPTVSVSVNGSVIDSTEYSLSYQYEDGGLQYNVKELSLNFGDKVVITDYRNASYSYDSGCGFSGTVSRSGSYDFYVKAAKDTIGVSVPAIEYTLNGTELFVVNPENSNKLKAAMELNKGASLIVKDNENNIYSDWENSGFLSDDNTVIHSGNYTIYLKLDSKKIYVDAPGHSYGTEVDYVWTDESACVAKRTCECGDVDECQATISNKVTQSATCSRVEKTTYTADFTVDWATTQTKDKQTAGKDANAHTEEPTWVSDSASGHHQYYSCCKKSTTTVNHDWSNNNGVCKDCEYRCEHTGNKTLTSVSETQHQNKCDTCHALTGEASAHDLDDHGICNDKCGYGCDHNWNSATCTEPQTCSKCGSKGGEALGHTYGIVSYIWSDNNTVCIATRTCSVCAEGTEGHTQTATATANSTQKQAQSCVNAAIYDYEAEFTVDWAETQIKENVENGSALGHDEVNQSAKAATCTEVGWDAYVTCSRCDYTTKIEIPALGHKGSKTEAKDATCTEAGNIDYWTCTNAGCGKIFSDEACTTELTDVNKDGKVDANDAEIAALGHTYGIVSYIWSDNNTVCIATRTCSVCAEGTEGHTQTATATANSTQKQAQSCVNAAIYDYEAEFTVDWAETQTKENVENGSALGHDEVNQSAKAATCTEVGWDAYVTCSRCDYTTKIEIPALGHKGSKTEAKDATCTEVGNIACWYCSVCEKYFIDEACTTELTDVNKDGKVDAKDAEIAALGHTYGIVSYNWRDDNTDCKATRTCSVCAEGTEGHTQTATATVESTLIKAQSCVNAAIYDYEAKFTFDWAETQIKENVENGSALGHAWDSDWHYDETTSGHYHICTREGCVEHSTSVDHADINKDHNCDDCGKEGITNHSYTAETASDDRKASSATCTAKATYYYSCSVCGVSENNDNHVFESGEYAAHKYGEWSSNNDGTHSRTCSYNSTHIETFDCSGGSATCTVQATCSVCSQPYGVLAAHNYVAVEGVSNLYECSYCNKEFKASSTSTWELLTDDSELSVGSKIIIVGVKDNSYYALGTEGTSNRKAVSISVSNNEITTIVDNVQLITVSKTDNGYFTLCDNSGKYFFASGADTKNSLATREDNNDNKGVWSIDINSKSTDATIKAIDSDTSRNWLRFNTGDRNNLLFSCYKSGQQDVYIYIEKVNYTPIAEHTCADNVTGATCTADGVCSICERTVEGTKVNHTYGEDHKCTECDAEQPKVYLASGKDVWRKDGAWFVAYFWISDDDNVFVTMTDVDYDGVYECYVPAGYENVIFLRMNPEATAPSFTDGEMWNQTANLKVPTDGNNCYRITGLNSEDVSWTKYEAKFWVRGDVGLTGSDWGAIDENLMGLDSEIKVWTLVYDNVGKGDYKIKVTNYFEDWFDNSENQGVLVNVKENHSKVTISFNALAESITVKVDEHVHNWTWVVENDSHKQTCICGDVQNENEHYYSEGYCACGKLDETYYFPKNIADLSALEDGTKVEFTGIVVNVTSSNNVTVSDGNGKTFYIYNPDTSSLSESIEQCDCITVKGVIGTYKDDKQISAGATITIAAEKIHTWDDATCTAAKTCSVCNVTDGDALGHNYVNGVCSRCSHNEGAEYLAFDITPEYFTIKSYVDNNKEKTITNQTGTYKFTSYQVMRSSEVMQWKKNEGYITTEEEGITKIEITSTNGNFTVTVGGKEITASTDKSNNVKSYNVSNYSGTIIISVGSEMGNTSSIKFYKNPTSSEGGGDD